MYLLLKKLTLFILKRGVVTKVRHFLTDGLVWIKKNSGNIHFG